MAKTHYFIQNIIYFRSLFWVQQQKPINSMKSSKLEDIKKISNISIKIHSIFSSTLLDKSTQVINVFINHRLIVLPHKNKEPTWLLL